MFNIAEMKLGHQIKSILDTRNMKQAELIRLMHELSPDIQYSNLQVSVSNTIKRNSESSKYLHLIAKALHMSTEDLLNWDPENKKLAVEQEFANYHVSLSGPTISTVDLIDINSAKHYKEKIGDISIGKPIPTDYKIRSNTFAVQAPDNSMAPLIYDGMAAIIEPELSPVPNDLVLATNNQVTFIRQLVKNIDTWSLKPLDENLETVNADDYDIIGVVVQAQLTNKFK